MKRLIAATVIFLSSCSAYALGYDDFRYCETIGVINAAYRADITSGKETEESVVEKIKQDKYQWAVKLQLAVLANSEGYTSDFDWRMSAESVCIKMMSVAGRYGLNGATFDIQATRYYKHKGW